MNIIFNLEKSIYRSKNWVAFFKRNPTKLNNRIISILVNKNQVVGFDACDLIEIVKVNHGEPL